MKKGKYVFLILLLLFPCFIHASEVDYDITNYYVDAEIKENGDMRVTEYIVLDGTFNGYIRDIAFRNTNLEEEDYKKYGIYNAENIELESIQATYAKELSWDKLQEYTFQNLKEEYAANGGYVTTDSSIKKSYKMYYKANNEKVIFRITYILKDVVVLHKDVAELYWTFIGEDYPDKLRDVQIKVQLPKEDSSNYFRAWAHGDLAGEIHLYDNQYILATIKTLDPNSSMDIRMTFAGDLLNQENVNKIMNKEALPAILEEEEARAEIANNRRKKMKVQYYTIFAGTIFWYVALLVSWIYVYFKYDKEYKADFHLKYNREFIDDYNVEVIDYLFYKNITPNALSASILNLIYKKNIRLEELASDKKKKTYIFYLENKENLTEAESVLVEFLFTKVGTENQFTTTDLQNYAKSTKTCEKFQANYLTWKNEVIKSGKQQNFYEQQTKPLWISGIFLISSLLLNGIKMILNVINLFTTFTMVVGVIFLIYTLCFNKRTTKGNEHYLKWKAFKNFLNDFGTFEIKELPEIKLWERYMVYATIFGLAEKVSKVMNVKIKEVQSLGVYTNSYMPTYTDWYVFQSINDSFHNAINQSARSVAAVNAERAGSSSSSGSGFGGGFSSGGGFGGGGGGGHGF